jgi:histidinol-phosphate aminotransferase
MQSAGSRVNWYCDPEGFHLREAIARRHNVARENVVLGAGIDDLLGLIVRSFVDRGNRVAMSLGAYPTFAFHVNGFGGKLVNTPYVADRNDPEALGTLARRCRARLVYLSNPDNPTGSWIAGADVLRLIERLPEGCVLVLDEAYADFAPPDALPAIDAEDPRVILLRTFSKAHGMAGARIGYAVAPQETIQAFDKIRHHFGVNRVAQEGAYASLGDPDFIAGVVRAVEQGRRDYERLAAELGLETLPSATNSVAIDLGTPSRATTAMKRLLEEEAVFVRMPGVAPLNRCIRVTVGTPPERAEFADAFRRVVAGL